MISNAMIMMNKLKKKLIDFKFQLEKKLNNKINFLKIKKKNINNLNLLLFIIFLT